MRHRKVGIKLNRTTSHRDAMFRNMVTSLFKYDRIKTTDVKAKELRKWADNLITLAKRGDLHARRQALAVVREKDVVHKLFEDADKRFGNKNGGYTRIIKLGRRPGDAAPISLIELVSAETGEKKKKKEKRAKEKPQQPAPSVKADQTEETVETDETQEVSAPADPVIAADETVDDDIVEAKGDAVADDSPSVEAKEESDELEQPEEKKPE